MGLYGQSSPAPIMQSGQSGYNGYNGMTDIPTHHHHSHHNQQHGVYNQGMHANVHYMDHGHGQTSHPHHMSKQDEVHYYEK